MQVNPPSQDMVVCAGHRQQLPSTKSLSPTPPGPVLPGKANLFMYVQTLLRRDIFQEVTSPRGRIERELSSGWMGLSWQSFPVPMLVSRSAPRGLPGAVMPAQARPGAQGHFFLFAAESLGSLCFLSSAPLDLVPDFCFSKSFGVPLGFRLWGNPLFRKKVIR